MRNLLTMPRAVYLHHSKNTSSTLNPLLSGGVVCKDGKSDSVVGVAFDQIGKCGCLCQFQINRDNEGTIFSATATTRRLVLGPDRLPLKTDSGRLLLTQCDCEVNNTISSVVASQCVGKPFDYAANEMYSPAASPAFHRTLARKLGLAPEKEHCLRLVERAAINTFTGRSVKVAVQEGQLLGHDYNYDVGAFSMNPEDEEEEEGEMEETASSFAEFLDRGENGQDTKYA
mmetsp:Transcript_18049/g.22749  ORF Transcript_18049/g.22749 Transcript_18049/m.22749 type:complete len:229 (-) Transcript_18049:456-1142(-)